MEDEDVPRRALHAGIRLTRALSATVGVAVVRGTGLLLAAELGPGIDAKYVADECLARGLLVNAVTPTALRLAPSLLVSDAEIDEAVGILTDVLDDAAWAVKEGT
jgi:acetylornithine/succinyldiaminopimelate/putrescine aminotransferase